MTQEGARESLRVGQQGLAPPWTNPGPVTSGRGLHLGEEAAEGWADHRRREGQRLGAGRASRAGGGRRSGTEVDKKTHPSPSHMLDRQSPTCWAHSCSNGEKARLSDCQGLHDLSVAPPHSPDGGHPGLAFREPSVTRATRRRAWQWSFPHEGGRHFNHNIPYSKRFTEILKCPE